MNRRRSIFDCDVPDSQKSPDNIKQAFMEIVLKVEEQMQIKKNVNQSSNEKKEMFLSDEQHAFINSTYPYTSKEYQRKLINFLYRAQILSLDKEDDVSVNLRDIAFNFNYK